MIMFIIFFGLLGTGLMIVGIAKELKNDNHR